MVLSEAGGASLGLVGRKAIAVSSPRRMGTSDHSNSSSCRRMDLKSKFPAAHPVFKASWESARRSFIFRRCPHRLALINLCFDYEHSGYESRIGTELSSAHSVPRSCEIGAVAPQALLEISRFRSPARSTRHASEDPSVVMYRFIGVNLSRLT